MAESVTITANITDTDITSSVVSNSIIAGSVTTGAKGDKGDTGATGPAGPSDHTLLTNIGTNTHAQIDTHIANVSNPHAVTKSQVGLSNVDNTSDTNKPVSTAQLTALNLKAPLASPTFTGTVAGITKSMVGLGNVPDTDFTAAVAANTAKISYPSADAAKLAGIATGATANSSDATLLNRTNHTGVQAQSTVTNLVTDLSNKAPIWNGGLDATPIIISPESTHASVIPYYMNDIAYNRFRGGSTAVYFDGVLQTGTDAATDRLFEPTSDTYSISITSITTIVIEVTMAFGMAYTMKLGYAVNEAWRAKDVIVEVYKAATSSWTTVANVADVAYGEKYWTYGGDANLVSKLRFTFSDFAMFGSYNTFRLGQIFALAYNGPLGQAPFVSRGGGEIYGAVSLKGGSTAAERINFSTDTNLYRSAANVLTTDDKLEALGGLRATSSSTSGHVWTATDTLGNGSWQATSGATPAYVIAMAVAL